MVFTFIEAVAETPKLASFSVGADMGDARWLAMPLSRVVKRVSRTLTTSFENVILDE